MLNCFTSTAHEDDLPRPFYSPSVLPQLSASTRTRSTVAGGPRLKSRPSLRFDKKRPSYSPATRERDGEKRAMLRKTMIGEPTGFKHVGGAGFDAGNEKRISIKPPVPPRPQSSQVPPLPLSNSNLAPASSSTPPPRPPPPRERPFSLPLPPRPTIDRSSLLPSSGAENDPRIVRRQSLTPPKRKPAPVVTPSLIQQLQEGDNKRSRPMNSTSPDLLRVAEKSLEIEELFTKSELKVIEKYEDVADGKVGTVPSTIKKTGGGSQMGWKGAMKEIERALQDQAEPPTVP
ncbi:uncharacterized protein JCM6883_001427 [Sporobolomyces salmoneus]|uniref:uncharacterized protein n=1 Tax=Sporobolomyces salmoneus TaxID=183962 RepID=UPI00317C6ECB